MTLVARSHSAKADLTHLGPDERTSFMNLQRVAKELGEWMTDEQLQETVDEVDCDGDGEVNDEEFLRMARMIDLF